MIRVIRVGGSLLTWSEAVPAFKRWLGQQSPAVNVLIAGGGPWVELLRQSAQRFEMKEPDAHVVCLRALSVTAELIGRLFDCEVYSELTDLSAKLPSFPLPSHVAFDVYEHLETIDAMRSDALPKTWDITSDSIAARVARDLEASELVLLKSADCPVEADKHQELGELGFVDPYFSIAAKGQSVRFVNLRSY